MASENNDDDIGGGSNESGEAPLWTYMTKKTKQGAKGRSWSFKCNICGETKSGSYSRVRAHLLGIKNAGIAPCKKVTRCEKLNMQRLEDEFEKKKSESGARAVPLPWETSSVASSAFKKRKSSISLLERAFGIEVKDQLDKLQEFFTQEDYHFILQEIRIIKGPFSLLLTTKLMIMCFLVIIS